MVLPLAPWLTHQSYRRQELGFRTSIYISAASASGAFGGLLAIGLSSIPRWGRIHTWRNIFFFEVSPYLPQTASELQVLIPLGLDLIDHSRPSPLANPIRPRNRQISQRRGEVCGCESTAC